MKYAVFAFALIAGASPARAQERPLELELLRTRAATGVTAVDAVASIDPKGLFDDDRCTYEVRVAVSDSTGARIVKDQWRRQASCDAFRDDPDARVVDTFSFGVKPGRYDVEMTVVPGGGGEPRTAHATVRSLPPDASVSDLYLAREVGWIDPQTSQGWALRKGQLGISTEADLELTTDRPFLGYYLELYTLGRTRTGGSVTGRILRPDGSKVVDFRLQTIDSLKTDRPVAGTVSVAGLPPGSYRLEVAVGFAGEPPVTRSREFRMTRPPEVAARPTPEQKDRVQALERYFSRLPDEELARFDALTLWMGSAEAQKTFESLSPAGKRAFLVEYFARATAPGPNGDEDALQTFIDRSRDVERDFTERAGRNDRPGWQTDRGRLYMLRGKPDDRIRRPSPGSGSKPYEIWYYNVGSGYVYLFVDEAGFGTYRLLYSTDPSQVTVPGWQRRAGAAALNELETYYGIQPQ